ncbi:MAG: hypothetical protein EXQ70_00145 [Solirubrobacterales bacterium]|nr:hypothetical protein [Solirubrobacterales bacterium]
MGAGAVETSATLYVIPGSHAARGAMLMYLVELRTEIERRPCGRLAERMLPEPSASTSPA